MYFNVTLTGVFAIPSLAAEDFSSITFETVITENNIIDVMDYLGLDSSKLIYGDYENGISSLTVGELQSYIKAANNEEPVLVATYSELMPATRASTVMTKMHYATYETSTYKVTFATGIKLEQFNAGLHIWEEFLDITSMDATIASLGSVTNTHAITKKNFNGRVIENGARARVDHELEITTYITVAFVKIPYNTATLTGWNMYTAQTYN